MAEGLCVTSTYALTSYVSNYSSARIFKKLLENVVDKNDCHIMHITSSHNSKSHFTKMLLDIGTPVDIKDSCGHTPLITAVNNGSEKNVKILLDHGADINVAICKNRSLLARRFYKRDLHIARILLPHLMGLEIKDSSIKNFDIFQQNICIFDSTKDLRRVKEECIHELLRMKQMKMCSEITVHDFYSGRG